MRLEMREDCGSERDAWAWKARHAACFSPDAPWTWSPDGEVEGDVSTEGGSGASDTDTCSFPASPAASEESLFSTPSDVPGWASHLSTTPVGWGPSCESAGSGTGAAAREATLQRAREERRPLKVRMPAGGEYLEALPAGVDASQPLKKRLPFGAACSMVGVELSEPLSVAVHALDSGRPAGHPTVAPR